MQLIDEDAGIDMLDTMNDRRIGREQVLEKFGVPPEKVGDVLALMGDSVDNVPGVPGIGPKTASQLIQQFGDLETVLAIDRPDHQAQIEAVADRPCRQCAAVARAGAAGVRRAAARAAGGPRAQGHPEGAAAGIPRGPGVQDAAAAGWSAAAPQQTGATVRNDVMAAMEPKKPAGPSREKIEVDRSKYETVTDEAALDRWIAEATRAGLCRDRYRDRLYRLHHRASSPGSASRPRRTAPATSPSATAAAIFIRMRPTSCRWRWCCERLKPLLEDPAVLKIGHNFKYDWVMFDKAGIDVAPVDDTMVMSFDLDAGRSFGHGLEELAKIHFDHEMHPVQAAVRDGRQADHLRQGAARPGDRICRRGRGHRAAAVAAAEAAAGAGERDPRLRARRQAAGAGDRADGAARDQGRPRLSGAAVGGVRARHPGARGKDLRGGVRAVHDRQHRSSSAKCCTSGSASRAGARARAGNIRPTSTSSSGSRPKGVDCATPGARMAPADQAQVDLHRRAAGADQPRDGPGPHQLLADRGADRAAVVERPQPAEHPDPDRDRAQDPRRLRRRCRAQVLLSADYSQIELRLAAHMADVPQLKEAFRAGADIHA